MNDAETCAANGWTIGDILEGVEPEVTETIEITAIGEACILARRLTRDGEAAPDGEAQWTLASRTWTKVT